MALAAPTAHHESPALRLKMNRTGLWMFFFSESIVFGLLLSTRFYLERINREELDQFLGLIITSILLLSSVTAFTAETAMEHNRQRLCSWMLLATIALGVIFAGGVALEWSTAKFSRHDAFGTVFFTMTGMHALHVITGFLMLGLVWFQVRRKKFDAQHHWPVSGVVMYWHFVDVVWVFFYPALYLVK